MKKLLKIIASINIFTFSFSVVSCGIDLTEVNYLNANHMYVLENTFSTKDTKEAFRVLPTLKPINLTEDKENHQLVLTGDNYLKFDCSIFDCSAKEFLGSSVSTSNYNNPIDWEIEITDFKEILKIQTAYDELAYWFQIEPFISENKNTIYDFSNLLLKANYQNNLYFFDKTEDEQLKLFAEQNLTISSGGESITKDFTFILEKEIFDLEWLNSLLLTSTAEIPKNDEVEESEQSYFKLVLKPNEKPKEKTKDEEEIEYFSTEEIENEIKKILNKYQSNLEFEVPKTNSNKISQEEINYEIAKKTTNLDVFKIGERLINSIEIDIVVEPDPETTDPETTDPETTDPETTDPETTDPETTDPETTDPETTDSETQIDSEELNLKYKINTIELTFLRTIKKGVI